MSKNLVAEFSILLHDNEGSTTVKIKGRSNELLAAIGSVCIEDHDVYLLLKEVVRSVDGFRASEGEEIISKIK